VQVKIKICRKKKTQNHFIFKTNILVLKMQMPLLFY